MTNLPPTFPGFVFCVRNGERVGTQTSKQGDRLDTYCGLGRKATLRGWEETYGCCWRHGGGELGKDERGRE